MAVTVVAINSINPSYKYATIQWGSNDFASSSASMRVATSIEKLAIPGERITKDGIIPDNIFQVEIPSLFLAEDPLDQGTTYYCQGEADGVLSSVSSFITKSQPNFSFEKVVTLDPASKSITIDIGFNVDIYGRVYYSTDPNNLTDHVDDDVEKANHRLVIPDLDLDKTYYAKVVAQAPDNSGIVLESEVFQLKLRSNDGGSSWR